MPLKLFRLLFVALALAWPIAPRAAEPGQATPDEVVQRVQEAVQYLAAAGEAGLAKFRGKGSAYVWKDSYVSSRTATGGSCWPIRPCRSAKGSRSRPVQPMAG